MFPSLAAREACVAETNFASRKTKNVFPWSQKHCCFPDTNFASETYVSQFSHPGKHNKKRCFRNNVSWFSQAFIVAVSVVDAKVPYYLRPKTNEKREANNYTLLSSQSKSGSHFSVCWRFSYSFGERNILQSVLMSFFLVFIFSMPSKVITILIKFIFLGINIFWAFELVLTLA